MLLDRIIENQDKVPGLQLINTDLLRIAELFICDNVSEYYHHGTDQDWWEFEKDFPNVAPPYPVMFFEYAMPGNSTSGVPEQEASESLRRVGVLIISEEVDAEFLAENLDREEAEMQYFASIISKLGRRQSELLQENYKYSIRDWYKLAPEDIKEKLHREFALINSPENLTRFVVNFKWVSQGLLFFENALREIFLICNLLWGVTHEGRPALFNDKVVIQVVPGTAAHKAFASNTEFRERMSYAAGYLHVPLLTLSFLHCKNVTLETTSYSEKQQKARIKKNQHPLVRYHVLNIHPMQKILREEGGTARHSLVKALHICRGHFKDFSRGSGLFGKYKGTYWWESYLRGSKTEGSVLKDYNVFAQRIELN